MLGFHRPSRRFWLAAVLVLVTLPVAQMAVAAKAGTVVCCCGEHAAGDDCGCPDCPSAVGHADDDNHNDDQEPGHAAADRIKRCGTDSFLGTPPSHFDVTLPVQNRQAERFRSLVPPPPLNRLDQTRPVPDSPPPERIAQL